MADSNVLKVAVTGASGYVASHVVQQCLEAGFTVRGTVRDKSRTEKVKHLASMDVELFEADLLQDGSFAECFEGCDVVIHCASPFTYTFEDAQRDLIDPALKGTMNVLDQAVKSGIKRVVVTSSTAAVMSQASILRPEDFVGKEWSEEDWNNESTLTEGPYRLSKALAEHKAWEYADKLEIATINPGFVLGPSLSQRLDGESVKLMKGLLTGEFVSTGVTGACFGCVDVRDVARAHVLCVTNPQAPGNRFVMCSAESFDKLQLAGMLRPRYSNLPMKFADGCSVSYRPYYNNEKARSVLGIKFTPIGKSLNEMADTMSAWL